MVVRMGGTLLQEGQPRRDVYRVDSGLLSYSSRRDQDSDEGIGFAIPGQFVGLGCMDTYVYSARALVETTVTWFSADAVETMLAESPNLETQLRHGMELEFRAIRQRSVARRATPVEQRVAALLVVLSRLNGYEGRDTAVVCDALDCGSVAQQLGIGVEDLSRALAGLERQGLIGPDSSGGLRLLDAVALERVADALER